MNLNSYPTLWQRLFVVHPTTWLKTLFTLAFPFTSRKFWHKLKHIHNVHDLHEWIAPAQLVLPPQVLEFNSKVHDKDGVAPPPGGYT